MSETTGKMKYIDVARGLALLIVIISHATGTSFFMVPSTAQTFFLISGYLYQAGRRPYGEQIKKSAERLLVPYFGYSFLLWAFYAVIRRNGHEMLHSLFGIVYGRFCFYDTVQRTDVVELMDVANFALWYLPAYFVGGLLFYRIVDRCLASWKKTVLWTVLLIALSMLLNQLPILLPWSLDMIGATALILLAGAWLRQSRLYEKKDRPWIVTGVVILYFVVLNLNGYLNNSLRVYGQFGSFSVPLYLIISIAGSMMYLWVSKWIRNTKLADLAAFLGVHSIELLCMHVLFLEIFKIGAEHFVDLNALPSALYLLYSIVRIATAIALSLLTGKIVALAKGKLLAGRHK